ncbi:hypothetical protein K3G63_03125 [Hymenobacter sp. HSC-4F20]|uniref:hypothetical protein n=1 Tax=Hymenobacter sp. HSC-4F20 TaxID=2864135 RepID=UPI001C731831|nr:hypothetical protein [Hymenobacter sp. HSC-4F20]MBX0289410.1 hypothetical protein [Hymenobacter sp. HSC-4F20]
MSTQDYWRGLSFDYIITYSLLRGSKWQQLQDARRKERETSRRLLLTAPPAQLPELRAQLHRLEHQLDLQTRLTTDNNRAYNITTTPVAKLQRDTPEVAELGRLLQAPCTELLYPMCAPVFRDALAFYNAGHELLSVLNICFSCNVMQTENGQNVEADYLMYTPLQEWFQRLGHQIDTVA